VQWHYLAAFVGKSRTNNSLEAGNNVLKSFFERKAHNIKEFIVKMKDFICEWSIQEKTSFPSQVNYKAAIRKAAEERAKDENFYYSEQSPDLLYYPRKGIDKIVLNRALEQLLLRKNIPQNLDEFYQGWCYFRVINVSMNQCDCADFYKYGYCKHLLALKMLDGELADPQIKEKKKRGRRALITKALMK
jgi:hypothetical protein